MRGLRKKSSESNFLFREGTELGRQNLSCGVRL